MTNSIAPSESALSQLTARHVAQGHGHRRETEIADHDPQGRSHCACGAVREKVRSSAQVRGGGPKNCRPSGQTPRGRLSRRHLRSGKRNAVPTARRHDPLGPVHRRAGEHGHAGAVSPLADGRGNGPRPIKQTRESHPEHRLLSQQGEEHQGLLPGADGGA